MKSLFFALTISLSSFALILDKPNFDPRLEGAFKVTVICRDTGNSHCKALSGNATLVIISSTRDHNRGYASLRMARSMYPDYVWRLTNVDENEEILQGTTSGVGGPIISQVAFDLDSHASKIKGWIRDTRFKFDLRVEGSQETSLTEYYASPTEELVVPPVKLLTGTYRGTLGEYPWLLSIQVGIIPEIQGEISGQLTHEKTGAKINFNYGEYFPELGTVALYDLDLSQRYFYKLTLGLRQNKANGILGGRGLSISGYRAWGQYAEFGKR